MQKLAGHLRCGRPRPTASSRSKRRSPRIHWTPEQSRDVEKTYNPMTAPSSRRSRRSSTGTRLLGKGSALPQVDDVVIGDTSAIQAAGKLFAQRAARDLEGMDLTFHFVSDHAQFLPKAFDEARFDFYAKTLHDVQTQRDRWKRGVRPRQHALGEGGRPDLRPAPLSGGKQPPDGRADRQHPRRAVARRSRTAAGWTRRPRRRRWRSSRPSTRAPAIPVK